MTLEDTLRKDGTDVKLIPPEKIIVDVSKKAMIYKTFDIKTK